MSVVKELETELTRAIEREVAAGRGRTVRAQRVHRGLRRLAAAAGVLAIGSAVAVAAEQVIPTGEPAKPTMTDVRPDAGHGALVPGTAKLLPVSAPDPDGGPDWGMRIMRTTRGDGCLEAARLMDGALGVIGRDGAFGNDGRFHPLPAAPSFNGCSPLDAGGHLFANVAMVRVPASAAASAGIEGCFARGYVTGVPASKLCDDASMRAVYFGVLGPRAKSVTYTTSAGESRTVPTTGPYGAYLIVDRPPARKMIGFGMGGLYPLNSPITEFAFADGTTCTFDPAKLGTYSGCAIPGYAPPPVRKYARGELSTPIAARAVRVGARWDVVVSFRAPVAIDRSGSSYAVTQRHSTTQRVWAGNFTDRNIAKGERVEFRFTHKTPGKRYFGTVSFREFRDHRSGGGTLGSYSVRVP